MTENFRDKPLLTLAACVPRRFSCVTLWTVACRLLSPWDSPDKNTGVGFHALLQGIVPVQGSNPSLSCLLHAQVGSLSLVPPGKPLNTGY